MKLYSGFEATFDIFAASLDNDTELVLRLMGLN